MCERADGIGCVILQIWQWTGDSVRSVLTNGVYGMVSLSSHSQAAALLPQQAYACPPDDASKNVPVAQWNNCAFTIAGIGEQHTLLCLSLLISSSLPSSLLSPFTPPFLSPSTQNIVHVRITSLYWILSLLDRFASFIFVSIPLWYSLVYSVVGSREISCSTGNEGSVWCWGRNSCCLL